MIYADPPFFSEEGYEILWHDGFEKRAFEDRWKGGIKNYVTWMEPKLMECYRVLKKTGSMYLLCDWHADAHLRILMDKIFDHNNFHNEIIWQRTTAHPNIAKNYGRLHDVILFYTKSEQYTWNTQYVPYSDEHIGSSYRNVEPKTGRHYALRDLTTSVYHTSSGQLYSWKGKKPPASRDRSIKGKIISTLLKHKKQCLREKALRTHKNERNLYVYKTYVDVTLQ
jgi:hypothetical protein